MNKGKAVKLMLLIILLGLMVILVIANLTTADVNLLFLQIKVPVIALILISMFLGYVLGLFTYNILFRVKKVKAEDIKKVPSENKKIEIPSEKAREAAGKKKTNKK